MEEWMRDEPLSIRNIVVKGNATTKDEFFQQEFKELRKAKTFGEAIISLATAQREIKEFDILKSLRVQLDRLPGGAVDLTVDVEEKDRRAYNLQAYRKTDTSTNEVELSGKLRNVFGCAEELTASVSCGQTEGDLLNMMKSSPSVSASSSSSSSQSLSNAICFNASLKKPRVFGTQHTATLQVFNTNAEGPVAEHNCGAALRLLDYSGAHELSLERIWRDVTPSQRDGLTMAHASRGLMDCCTPSVKSSLKHQFKIDLRDNPHCPTFGSFFCLQTELAGIGGDVQFLKSEVKASRYLPLTESMSLGMSICGGLVCPWSSLGIPSTGPTSAIPIQDRFFCGGPLDVRGFKPFAIAPRRGGCPVGGELFASGSVDLSFPLPSESCKEKGVRGRIFTGFGNSCTAPSAGVGASLMKDMRVAVGVGIVAPLPFGRFELNFSQPVRVSTGDLTQRAQFGIGISYL